MFNQNGSWNTQKMRGKLSPMVINNIVSETPFLGAGQRDTLAWSYSSDGWFSIATAYQSIQEDDSNVKQCNFNRIWSWKGPQRVRVLLWKIANDALMTNSNRRRRNITNDDTCMICNTGEVEDLLHALRDYVYAKRIWQAVVPSFHQQRFFSCSIYEWLEKNLKGAYQSSKIISWEIMFGVICESVWHRRNKKIFEDFFIDLDGLRQLVWRKYKDFTRAFNDHRPTYSLSNSRTGCAAKFVSDGVNPAHPCSSSVSTIRKMLQQGDFRIGHTLREANSAADALTKYAHSMQEDFTAFDQPPSFLSLVLFADSSGTCFPRGF
ncbi:hypothetical protein RIF29_00390 [Crotalaria pallida]|uniref:Reverse transcriptase zinc-binding domain-containing protein n=1 Tax=Crotalaria pallida TaxID=3830 RepID=A0AAN9IW31_CROPI